MSAVTGIFRNGRVELDGPTPDWDEGTPVRVERPEPEAALDITGDSPEAIAAWLEWYEAFLALPRSPEAGDKLQRVLAGIKAERKAGIAFG